MAAAEPEPTGWFFPPLIVSRSTRTMHKGQRRLGHRMVSACDGSLEGSVKSHPDAGPPTFISVSADAKLLSKSSKFIVYVQVSWISFSRTRRFLFFSPECIMDISGHSRRLRKNEIYPKYIWCHEI